MRKLLLLVVSVLCFAVLLAGCRSARQIQASEPRPARAVESSTPERLSPITVSLEAGPTPLHALISEVRFRIKSVELHEEGGEWQSFPADANVFDVRQAQRPSRVILRTSVAPGRLDSLGLVVADAFVLFGANAGGPLTSPGASIRLPVNAAPVVEQPVAVRVLFEPETLVVPADSCRWEMRPVFRQVSR